MCRCVATASANMSFLTAILSTIMFGCADEPKVSYIPPELETPHLSLSVPDSLAGAPPGDSALLKAPSSVRPSDVVEFTGRFRPRESGKVMAVVVNFLAAVNGSERLIFNSQVATPTEDKDGYWSYRVPIVAPEEPREYDVEIIHFGDLVASGKLKVE